MNEALSKEVNTLDTSLLGRYTDGLNHVFAAIVEEWSLEAHGEEYDQELRRLITNANFSSHFLKVTRHTANRFTFKKKAIHQECSKLLTLLCLNKVGHCSCID